MPKLKSIVVFSIILFGILLFTKISQAATYYVDGSCGSSGNGTTAVCGATGPWKTLNEAATGVPAGGNTINVAVGTYNERVSDNRNGASDGNYRWWKANGTVNMQGFASYADYWRISGFTIETVTAGDPNGFGIRVGAGSDYWLIENNTIQDSVGMGIFVWRSNHITVKNNTVMRSAEAGILSNGEYNVIQDNDISDIRNTIKGVTPAAYQADGIRVFGGYGTYKGNYIHDISYAHQTCNGIMGGCNTTYEPPHIDAFQTWGSTAEQPVVNNAVFEKNHIVLMEKAIHNNTALHGFMINGGAHDLTFKNNIFEVHNFMNSGNTGGYKPYNLYFYNNTFRSSLSFSVYPYPWADCFSFTGVTGTVEIKNNITIDFPYGHYGKDSTSDATFIQKNNVIYNSDGSTPGMGGMSIDATDLWKIDPKFVTNYTDLHLQSSSPAKDRGATIASVTDDYDGISRPQPAGGAYDIGAYEFVQASDTTAPSTPTNLAATTISSSQINLSWTNSIDNVGVVSYRVYRGGSQIATSATNSYSDTDCSPSTSYSYTVAAYDAAGNMSGQSGSASATTQTPSVNNYYVNGSCSSSGNGTTAVCGTSGPWKTLGEASANVPTGTHTINVAAGTYNENITESHSGTDSTHFLHWLANGTAQINGSFVLNGNYIKLEGFTLTSPNENWNGTIHISGDYCAAVNNIIINSHQAGIFTADTADHATISGNLIKTVWLNGIAINGTNHTVSNNDISDMRCKMGGNFWEDANGIEFHGSGHTFIGNYIHNITFAANPGYSPHIDAFQTYGAGSNCIFEKNRIDILQQGLDGNANNVGWMLAQSSNITIKNNIIRAYAGVNTGGGGNSNLTIVNNTFLNDLTLNTSWWPSGIGINNVPNCTVKNNIFYNHYYKAWEAGGTNLGLDVDYNCIYKTSGSYNEIRKTHDAWAQDPKFVNTLNDWYLQSSSPCKDVGVNLYASGVTNDYAGTARPQGAGYDIGAYEYIEVSDATPPAAPTGVTVR